MSDRVPRQPDEAELIVARSRFLAFCAPAPSVEVARQWLAERRAAMPDATHHVYAFRVGHNASVIEGMSDDGEPSGTAGPPIMAVLRGAGLGDALVVVTRYYGGVKLGTGGLVRAYTDAARTILAQVPTIEKVARVQYEMTVPYHAIDAVRRALTPYDATVEEQAFEATHVRLTLALPEAQASAWARTLADASAGQAKLTLKGTR